MRQKKASEITEITEHFTKENLAKYGIAHLTQEQLNAMAAYLTAKAKKEEKNG